MTSLSLPDSRRRFLQMLWFSAALHALVIGLTRLPPLTLAALPPELQVQFAQPAPTARPPAVTPEPQTLPRQTLPAPAKSPPLAVPPSPVVQSSPQPVPAPSPEALPRAVVPSPVQTSLPAALPSAASREAPGPQVNIPLTVDSRYYATRELDPLPAALHKPDPVYPPQAEDQGVSGSVLLRLHLEADGSISQTEVVSATPAGVFGDLFKKSALDSIRTLRFRPAKRNGQPVRALVEFRVVFEQGGAD